MPSFQDSALIFFIALLLFGPKKLPELARQLGKLMGEFRRASNEFRIQMEDELRLAEQNEQQKKIEAMQSAAPPTPAISEPENIAPALAVEEHTIAPETYSSSDSPVAANSTLAPLPIATSGDLSIMPPETGLPSGRTSLASLVDSVPRESEQPPHETGNYAAQPNPDHKPHQDHKLTSEASFHG